MSDLTHLDEVDFKSMEIKISDIWCYIWTRREECRRANPDIYARSLKLLRITGPTNLKFEPLHRINHGQPGPNSRWDGFAVKTRGFETRRLYDDFEVQLSTRDDEIDAGIATITCKRFEEYFSLAHEQMFDLRQKTKGGGWMEDVAKEVVDPCKMDLGIK